jgi:hypothetical protein
MIVLQVFGAKKLFKGYGSSPWPLVGWTRLSGVR